MLAFTTWPLEWARSLGHRFFLQFGLHCATHQVRVILISGVVITSLFYPALDVYTSSRTSSQSILDALLSPNSAANYDAGHDLVDLWSGHDTLRIHQKPVTRAKCINGHALRVERVLIQSPVEEDDGAVNHKILLSTFNVEQRIQRIISTGDSPCLKKPDGSCLVISPLSFWNYDKDELDSDVNILDTLSYTNNVTVAGIPITPHMVLAGRGSEEPNVGGNNFDYASYLVLTYFFPHNACLGSSSEHGQWVQIVETAVGQTGEVEVRAPEATLIALEYDPHRDSITQGWSAISAFLYLAYIVFFAYVAWSVRRMDAVHSRLGVTFTALVEIAVSTITSLSVCALVGFRITMVPWELLPIVIVFVGAENMFNLVDAVGKTSVTLPVKQRIAEGLSRAGTSNTLKVVSYNAILGVIAVFSAGAVRQFCAFAIVVLVAHWFLAHTFFMAVLSIDIARLELEELLRYDASLAPSMPSMMQNQKDAQNSKPPRSGWQKLIFTIKNLLKGRAATNISLLMLLGIAATLYYTTYTTPSTSAVTHSQSSSPKPLGAIARSKKTSAARAGGPSSSTFVHPAISTAEQIWKILNPAQTPLLHLRLELPTKITFSPDVDALRNTAAAAATKSKYSGRTFRFVLWLLTIMVLPMATTLGALYGLLLYLLKNTELLEAQRHRLGADDDETSLSSYAMNGDEKGKGKTNLEGEVKFSTLPRAFSSDVELVASSKDGKVVVSVGLHNEIVVWDSESRECVVSFDAGDVLLRMLGAGLGNGVALGMMASTSSSVPPTITSLCIDEDGKHFAVGTGSGLIAAWVLDQVAGKKNGKGLLKALPVMMLDGSMAGITELKFADPIKKAARTTPPPNGLSSEPSSPESKAKLRMKDAAKRITLLATYESGTAAKWTIPSGSRPNVVCFVPSRHATVVRAILLPVLPDGRLLIAFCLEDGTLDIIETGEYEPIVFNQCVLQAGNPYDLVWKVHACRAEIGGSMRLVIAAATEAGAISLWDGLTGECISVLDEAAHGRVNQLRVSPVQCQKCHFCGQMPMESLSVAFSVDHVVRFEKLYIDDTSMATTRTARRCSCSRASAHLLQKTQELSRVSSKENLMLGRRSRSNSNAASSQSSSPLIPRARLATAFEANSVAAITAAFPVSGHGVHSRRASEKEGVGRRSSELLTVPPFPTSHIVGNGDDYDGMTNSDILSGVTTPTGSASSIWRNSSVVPLVDVTCERGGWDASGNLFIGVRRKPRSQGKIKNVAALAAAQRSSAEDGLTNATLERWEVWSFDPTTAVMRTSLLSSISVSSSEGVSASSSSSTTTSPLKPSKSTAAFSIPSHRSHSSSSSTSSSLSSSSGPGESIARLPFTRVSPLFIAQSHAVAGFGNTIGVFQFASS